MANKEEAEVARKIKLFCAILSYYEEIYMPLLILLLVAFLLLPLLLMLMCIYHTCKSLGINSLFNIVARISLSSSKRNKKKKRNNTESENEQKEKNQKIKKITINNNKKKQHLTGTLGISAE